NISIAAKLPRTETRLKSGARLKVVALGSSSTVGLWVSNSSATYPAVMRQELIRLVPNAQIELINSGRIGDTIPGNVARIDRDVLFHQPDLVIWQLGTNDIAWGGQTKGLEELVVGGVRTLKSRGLDVILMDQQYAPQVLSSSQFTQMQTIIANAAAACGCGCSRLQCHPTKEHMAAGNGVRVFCVRLIWQRALPLSWSHARSRRGSGARRLLDDPG